MSYRVHPYDMSHKDRLKALSKYGLTKGVAAHLMHHSPGQLYHMGKMKSDIEGRAQKKEVYAKPILEMTPRDIENASSLYVVKTHVPSHVHYGGWSKHTLPAFCIK